MKDPTRRTERLRQTRKGFLTLPRAVVLGVLVLASFGAGVQFFSSAGNSDGDGDANRSPDPPLPAAGVQALNVEVAQPIVDLGRVALNTPAGGQWLLRNTGSGPISLGRPSIEVLEGC